MRLDENTSDDIFITALTFFVEKAFNKNYIVPVDR